MYFFLMNYNILKFKQIKIKRALNVLTLTPPPPEIKFYTGLWILGARVYYEFRSSRPVDRFPSPDANLQYNIDIIIIFTLVIFDVLPTLANINAVSAATRTAANNRSDRIAVRQSRATVFPHSVGCFFILFFSYSHANEH